MAIKDNEDTLNNENKTKRIGKTKPKSKSSLKEKENNSLSPESQAKRSMLIREAAGLTLIFLGVFLMICLLLPYSTGFIGLNTFNLFTYLFGYGAYVFPLLLVYLGFQLALRGAPLPAHWTALLVLLLYIDTVILVYLVLRQGGVIGNFAGENLLKIAGESGGYLFVFAAAFTIIMILTQLTIKQVFKGIYKFISFMGLLIEKAFKFLTLKHDDEILDQKMEKMPDLSQTAERLEKESSKTKKTTRKISTKDLEEQEDEEDEEESLSAVENDHSEDEHPSECETEPDKPKRVLFFDEEDFIDSEEIESIDSLIDSAELNLNSDSQEIPQQSLLSKDNPLNGNTWVMKEDIPFSFDQLNLFEEKPKVKAKKEPDLPPKTPVANYKYKLPPLSLLKSYEKTGGEEPARDYSQLLEETLANFGVTVKVTDCIRGPAVSRYELQPAKGVKVSKITNLSNDIALALAAYSIRIEAPIPGKSAIGIEIPNHRIDPVFLRDILYAAKYKKHSPLSLALGKDITGKPVMGDLLKMPHMMIAGATGSGKSVCINSVIASILFKATPLDVQMVMVDPKRVELSLFEGIPHLVDIKLPSGKKIITDPKAATMALKIISELMDNRYEDFVALKVRNIVEYNEKAEIPIPFIVVIIDELADLMMISSSTVEQYICRIAQLGRASGIHLILATQRPSVDVITGLIKANIPSRAAFAVSSQVDSRTILDKGGAEKLLGKGDMLYLPVDASEPRRIQGAYISGEEIERLVDFWKEQPPPENSIPMEIGEIQDISKGNDDDQPDDELLQDALETIKTTRQASVSNLQRKMRIGYARAGRIMDQLEKKGFVGPSDGSKPRKILLPGFEMD